MVPYMIVAGIHKSDSQYGNITLINGWEFWRVRDMVAEQMRVI